MAPESIKPATASGKPASNVVEQLGGRLISPHSNSSVSSQDWRSKFFLLVAYARLLIHAIAAGCPK